MAGRAVPDAANGRRVGCLLHSVVPHEARRGATFDGAGEVIAINDGMRRVRVGDRVAGCFHPRWFGGPTD